MFSGLQQLWDQTAPALLQQLPLQGHLGVLMHPLLMGAIEHRVQTCLRDQLLVEQEGTRISIIIWEVMHPQQGPVVLLEFQPENKNIFLISTKKSLAEILAPT